MFKKAVFAKFWWFLDNISRFNNCSIKIKIHSRMPALLCQKHFCWNSRVTHIKRNNYSFKSRGTTVHTRFSRNSLWETYGIKIMSVLNTHPPAKTVQKKICLFFFGLVKYTGSVDFSFFVFISRISLISRKLFLKLSFFYVDVY